MEIQQPSFMVILISLIPTYFPPPDCIIWTKFQTLWLPIHKACCFLRDTCLLPPEKIKVGSVPYKISKRSVSKSISNMPKDGQVMAKTLLFRMGMSHTDINKNSNHTYYLVPISMAPPLKNPL